MDLDPPERDSPPTAPDLHNQDYSRDLAQSSDPNDHDWPLGDALDAHLPDIDQLRTMLRAVDSEYYRSSDLLAGEVALTNASPEPETPFYDEAQLARENMNIIQHVLRNGDGFGTGGEYALQPDDFRRLFDHDGAHGNVVDNATIDAPTNNGTSHINGTIAIRTVAQSEGESNDTTVHGNISDNHNSINDITSTAADGHIAIEASEIVDNTSEFNIDGSNGVYDNGATDNHTSSPSEVNETRGHDSINNDTNRYGSINQSDFGTGGRVVDDVIDYSASAHDYPIVNEAHTDDEVVYGTAPGHHSNDVDNVATAVANPTTDTSTGPDFAPWQPLPDDWLLTDFPLPNAAEFEAIAAAELTAGQSPDLTGLDQCPCCCGDVFDIALESDIDFNSEWDPYLRNETHRPEFIGRLTRLALPGRRKRVFQLSNRQQRAEAMLYTMDMSAEHMAARLPLSASSELVRWFDIFNNLYFFGALSHDCVMEYLPMRAPHEERLQGCTTFHRLSPIHNRQAHIRVFQNLDASYDSVRSHVSCLLHEMLHAYLCLHCCLFCSLAFRHLAIGGHGAVWQDLAYHIQRDLRNVYGLALQLDAWQGLCHDVCAYEPRAIGGYLDFLALNGCAWMRHRDRAARFIDMLAIWTRDTPPGTCQPHAFDVRGSPPPFMEVAPCPGPPPPPGHALDDLTLSGFLLQADEDARGVRETTPITII